MGWTIVICPQLNFSKEVSFVLTFNRYVFCFAKLLLTAYSVSMKIHHVSSAVDEGGLFLGSLVFHKLQ